MFASCIRLFFFSLALLFSLSACGNRFDLGTERGRRARIDDANFHLSRGSCGAAHEAIDPLYNSAHVDDEVRIVKASAYACEAGFELLTIAANLASMSNYFEALAKSMKNSAGDGARTAMYKAIDVLTEAGAKMSGSQRSSSVNSYMIFLQMGALSAILRNYGSPGSDGSQGADLVFVANGVVDANEMATVDACAVTAAFASISDSYPYSGLSDSTTSGFKNSLEAACVSAGLSSCAVANKDRAVCTGGPADPNSLVAEQVITEVNNAW